MAIMGAAFRIDDMTMKKPDPSRSAPGPDRRGRRNLLGAVTVGLGVGASFMAGARAEAAAARSAGLKFSTGFITAPSTFYEVVEPAVRSRKPPVVMVHGGAHSGACMLTTADGRPGWAPFFASRGYRVIVPDWPGTARSGYLPSDDITGEVVVRGLGELLRMLDEPAIVMTHSMSGPFGWKLMEQHGDRISKLIGVAPGGPGNLMGHTEFLSDTAETVEARFSSTAPILKLNKRAPFVAEAGWAKKKLIGSSTQWPVEATDRYLASLLPIPPRLLLERVDYQNAAPRVTDFSKYRGARVLIVTGTNDADHPVEIDRPIAQWLVTQGVKADYVALGEAGIVGNGHMMMMERNSDLIAAGLVAWLETGRFPRAAG